MVEVPENFSMTPEQFAQMQPKANPLQRFMRQPSIYVKLPSQGVFWAQGALEMPVNGEIPILPMSTADEITLNTPDALMNGVGVVDMIHSCCPNIKNAWEIPITDLDIILIGIRIASYGEKMEYTSTCPHCENQDNYEVDLRLFIDQKINMDLYNQPFEYKGMNVFVKPINFESVNQQNLETFEQQRLVTMINDSSLSAEEKQRRFAEIFSTMTQYTVKNVTGSIRKIVTPEGEEVWDPDVLYEFVKNSERQFYDSLKKHMTQIQDAIPKKQVTTNCEECKQEYTSPFTFDQANFFGFAS